MQFSEANITHPFEMLPKDIKWWKWIGNENWSELSIALFTGRRIHYRT